MLADISFDVAPGEFLSLFGPNGCGKTTLLHIIAGITTPDEGAVTLPLQASENDATSTVGIVFQEYDKSLLPWRRCIDNIAFPLESKGAGGGGNRESVRKLLADLDIELPLDRFPYQMSGGQKQLTCVARALIRGPQLLLLDEPFASLDYQTRLSMHGTIQRICQRAAVTTVFVSHEIDEAVFLADRVVLLTKRPATIASVFEVEQPRPRIEEVFSAPEFLRTRSLILDRFLREAGE